MPRLNKWLPKFIRGAETAAGPGAVKLNLQHLEVRDVPSAVVTPDKDDYPPGSVAVFAASNDASTEAANFDFANEAVEFRVTRRDHLPDYASGNIPIRVQDNVSGFEMYLHESGAYFVSPDMDPTEGVVQAYWGVEWQYADSALLLTGTGLTSGATATKEFTDSAASLTITTPASSGTYSPSSGFSDISGAAAWSSNGTNRTVQVSIRQGSTGPYWNGTSFSSGSEVLFTATAVTSNGSGKPWSYAFASSNLPSSGSYTVRAVAQDSQNSQSTSNTFTFALISTTTAVTSSSPLNTSTYGQSVTFTATVTAASGTASPTGSVEFFDGTTSLGVKSITDSTGSGTSTWSISTSSLNASSHTIRAVYSATGSFTGSTSSNLSQTVNKATATVNLGSLNATYDGAAKSATATTNATGASTFTFTYNGSSTAPTNAGSYTVVATLNNDNYQGSTTGARVIGKAATTTTVTIAPGTFTYTGSAITPATVTVTGAGGLSLAPDAVYANNTNAGTATASYSFAESDNYLASSDSKTFEIGKATATVSVVNYSGAYDGLSHTASVTITGMGTDGVLASNSLTGTNVADSGSVAASTSDSNYFAASGTATLTISKADATIDVSGYAGVYDGNAHGATGTAKGVQGETLAGLDLGASFTNVPGGTATWTFTDATGNYNDATGSVQITILVPSTVTVSEVGGNILVVGTD